MTDSPAGQTGSHTAERSDSHDPSHEIQRRMDIRSYERLFLWLAKWDEHVMSRCPSTVRKTLKALGMMVAFTTVLAFVSALYTIKTTLIPPDFSMGWAVSIVLAAVYAYGIMAIDRVIVSASNSRAILIRIPFAVMIALAVSYPVKLLFFEGRIASEIDQMVQEENAPVIKRIEALKADAAKRQSDRRGIILDEIASFDKEVAVLDKQIEEEAKKIECGPKCQEYRRQKEDVLVKRARSADRLDAVSAPGYLPEDTRLEVEGLQTEIANRRAIAYDFLYKIEALDRIAEEVGTSYTYLSWFLILFFAALELVPMALKLSLGMTEYHYYIEARTALNNQKIVSITNLYLSRMQEDDQAVMDVPIEVTDIIAHAMEDESTPMRRARHETLTEALAAERPAARPPADPVEGPTPTEDPREQA